MPSEQLHLSDWLQDNGSDKEKKSWWSTRRTSLFRQPQTAYLTKGPTGQQHELCDLTLAGFSFFFLIFFKEERERESSWRWRWRWLPAASC